MSKNISDGRPVRVRLPSLPISILLLTLLGQAPIALGQERLVGGHIGFGFPLVTHAGNEVTSIADSYQMSLPVGINVSGPGRMYFDLEFVTAVVDKPRQVNLTVNPGLLWRLGHGFAAGSRIGLDVNT